MIPGPAITSRAPVTEAARPLPAIDGKDAADWRPGVERAALAARAGMLASCRRFFAERAVMEVETPLLSSAAATDPACESIASGGTGGVSGFLATSPEFAMKRLLAAGSGDIYQICKAFRNGERGALHNPEFSMLEWYRAGFDLEALMQEVAALLAVLLDQPALARRAIFASYQDLFREHLALDPLSAKVADVADRLQARSVALPEGQVALDELLDLALATLIIPTLDRDRLFFVYDFPISQAALARRHPAHPGLARRFEAIYQGVELANGFEELDNADEQESRFKRDLDRRRRSGLATPPMDRRLLAALAHGLPACAGVALGLDRVLMLALGVATIDQVIAFPMERA